MIFRRRVWSPAVTSVEGIIHGFLVRNPTKRPNPSRWSRKSALNPKHPKPLKPSPFPKTQSLQTRAFTDFSTRNTQKAKPKPLVQEVRPTPNPPKPLKPKTKPQSQALYPKSLKPKASRLEPLRISQSEPHKTPNPSVQEIRHKP